MNSILITNTLLEQIQYYNPGFTLPDKFLDPLLVTPLTGLLYTGFIFTYTLLSSHFHLLTIPLELLKVL